MKWILGIVLAAILTLVPASLFMHHTGDVDMNNLNAYQYWVQFLALPSLAFGLFLFLACVLVPCHKRIAGHFVFLLSLLFIGLGLYQHYTDDGFLRPVYLIRYSGFILCLSIGFALSYKIYRQQKWTTN